MCTSTVLLSAGRSRCHTSRARSARLIIVEGCSVRYASSLNSRDVSVTSVPPTQAEHLSWSSSIPVCRSSGAGGPFGVVTGAATGAVTA
jgi:hypothetical protein